jgi:hypothetical protein
MADAYNTEFIKSAPAYAAQADLFVLENEIDFEDNNLGIGDTVRLLELDGIHVLKVMWEVKPCNAAATITLGDSDDADGWSNAGDITCSTTADVVGCSDGSSGLGGQKSYPEDDDDYLLMTIGTAALTSGSIKVKALCVRM